MGGTELLPTLDAMLRARDKHMLTDIIVLTDGEVWRLEQTVQLIRDTRRDSRSGIRCFSLGIGNAVSHALAEGIAKTGGGYAEIIPSASQGGWEDRVVAMTRAVLTSKHISPLHLSFEIKTNETDQGEI